MAKFNYLELAKELGIMGRVSGGQFIGLCPLHKDTEPSFSMNIKGGMWTCFAGCGAGGFESLVCKIHSCNFQEAKDWMLLTSNLVLQDNPDKKAEDVPEDMRWLWRFNAIDNSVMPQWWFDRNLTWDTVNNWDIRYNEERSQIVIPFYNMNPPAKFKNQQIGLALMGTVTRNLKDGPKYVNSPNLPRSQYLFGLAQSQGPLILITEGPLDALRIAQEGGLPPVAALLGLQMSDDHIRLLHKFGEVCLALDNDSKGVEARERHKRRLYDIGRPMSQVSWLELPSHRKDVGECTGEELRQALQNRRN